MPKSRVYGLLPFSYLLFIYPLYIHFKVAPTLSTFKKLVFYGGPQVPRQEQINHVKRKFITANYPRQNEKQITGQRFGQQWRHLPFYNIMLSKHHSLSLNIPSNPSDLPIETKRKQNKENQAKTSSCSAQIAEKKKGKVRTSAFHCGQGKF